MHAYDERWPTLYSAEAECLAKALGPDLAHLEHVGSTAVPGLDSHPTIDVVAAVSFREPPSVLAQRLRPIGFQIATQVGGASPDRLVYAKGPHDPIRFRSYHLYVTEVDSSDWRRMIAFRDYLRDHPKSALAYGELKRDLAHDFANQPRRYEDGRRPFIIATERKAGFKVPGRGSAAREHSHWR